MQSTFTILVSVVHSPKSALFVLAGPTHVLLFNRRNILAGEFSFLFTSAVVHIVSLWSKVSSFQQIEFKSTLLIQRPVGPALGSESINFVRRPNSGAHHRNSPKSVRLRMRRPGSGGQTRENDSRMIWTRGIQLLSLCSVQSLFLIVSKFYRALIVESVWKSTL